MVKSDPNPSSDGSFTHLASPLYTLWGKDGYHLILSLSNARLASQHPNLWWYLYMSFFTKHLKKHYM